VKGYWFKSENGFTSLIHRVNLFFEPAEGSGRLRPELSIVVDVNWFDRSALVRIVNASGF